MYIYIYSRSDSIIITSAQLQVIQLQSALSIFPLITIIVNIIYIIHYTAVSQAMFTQVDYKLCLISVISLT